MSQCSVCSDKRITAIDQLLAAGRSAQGLAHEFGLSPDAMRRHKRNLHVMATAPQRKVPPPQPGENPLAALVEEMRVKAATSNNPSYAREYRLALEAQAKWQAEQPKEQVNLADTDEWIELREKIMAVLRRFPEAYAAMKEAFAYQGDSDG